jgi:hypothetical protein
LVLLVGLSSGCKPKVGGKCKTGQSFCTKEGALLCGDDNKFVATGCHGPGGCVQTGSTASCDMSVAVAGDPCEEGTNNIACSTDKKAELDCKGNKWVVGATCKGAKGCELKDDELFCDHTLGDKDDPCHRDGQIACTMDKTFILRCEGLVFRAIDSCRGPKACTFEEHPERQLIEFDCDDSVAQEGDPCASENFHACSTDKKAIHVCQNKKFVQIKACTGPKGCTLDAAARKLSCDTGSGIFLGSGGSAKVSSAGGAEGAKSKAKAGTDAGAKPAGTVAVAGSAAPGKVDAGPVAAAGDAGAKPADAGAATAADAGAKPAADAGAKPAASAKPVPTVKKKP